MKTSVRFLAILFVLVMAMFTVSLAADYSDVNATTAHKEAIDFLSTMGILTGYDDGKFLPDELVEREEMAKIIYVTATTFFDGVEQKPSFSDVTADNWAAGYISWCVATDIVGGFGDNTFRPEANITYNQALKMVASMLGYTDFRSELWPQDVQTVALKTLDLGKGIPETVTGDSELTRAQTAQIVYNALFENMNLDIEYVEGKLYTDEELAPKTLIDDVWNYSVTTYQIVATENYGSVSFINPSPYYNTETGEYVDIHDPSLIKKYYDARATQAGNKIIVWDGVEGSVDENTTPDFLSKWGLEEYKDKTDDILGFTIKEISKDGKVVFTSEIQGERIDGMSIDCVKTTAADYPKYAYKESTAHWRNDKMVVNGIIHEGEDFENLRVVALLEDEAGNYQFNIFPQITTYGRGDKQYSATDSAHKAEYEAEVIDGFWWQDRRFVVGPGYDTNPATWASNAGVAIYYPDLIGNELNINVPYVFNSYARYVRGVDKDSDGIIDYVFLKWMYPYEVVSATVNNGVKTLTIKDLFDAATPNRTIPAENVEFSAGELKQGDVFVGAFYGENLYVDATFEPTISYATAVGSDTITFNEVGTVQGGALFVPRNKYGSVPALAPQYKGGEGANPSGRVMINDARLFGDLSQKLNFLGKTAEGTNKLFKFWLRGKNVIKVDHEFSKVENTGFDKAILMYVAEPTDEQLNKLNNKLEIYYPAYLIINGKEEAVNLNPSKALKTSDAPTYLHAESVWTDPEYALIVDTSNNDVIINQYKLVTYEVDTNGYYTIVDSSINPDDAADKTEKIFREIHPSTYTGFHDFRPQLVYNKNTGLFNLIYYDYDITLPGTQEDKIITNVISVDVSEDTYLYYTSTTPSGYVDLKFYSAEDLINSNGFEAVRFVSDVYLEYDPDTDYYILETGIIENKLSFGDGASTQSTPSFEKDGKVIKLAVEDAAKVAENGDIYYEHVFLDITTGEKVYELQDNRPIVSTTETPANTTLAGKFYAWDYDAKNYVQVSAKQIGVVDANFYGLREVIVSGYDAARNILYFEQTGSPAEYDLFLQDAYKIADDFKFYAVDDDYNQYELSFAEVADIFENIQMYNAQESASVKHKMVFVGHKAENEIVFDYAITTYAGVETDEDTVTYFVDDNVIDSLYGI